VPFEPPQEPPTIWTLGHSNHSWQDFAGLLAGERIETLIDVRSSPYSRFAPQFNREALLTALPDAGIAYYFQGNALGGRPECPDHYDSEGHALYGEMAAQPAFRAAINSLLTAAATQRLALLCACGKPADCHRRLLVGRVLADHGASLRHILPDGSTVEESEVKLSAEEEQTNLFGGSAPAWRSTQSVSRRARPRISSAA
jgi:uncharacterized protein (DUF488 family)